MARCIKKSEKFIVNINTHGIWMDTFLFKWPYVMTHEKNGAGFFCTRVGIQDAAAARRRRCLLPRRDWQHFHVEPAWQRRRGRAGAAPALPPLRRLAHPLRYRLQCTQLRVSLQLWWLLFSIESAKCLGFPVDFFHHWTAWSILPKKRAPSIRNC